MHTLDLIEERLFYHGPSSEPIRFIDDQSSSVESGEHESEPDHEDMFSEEGNSSATESSSHSSFEESNETGELKEKVSGERGYSDPEDDEIETERWAENGQSVRKSNSGGTSEMNEEEQDRRSQFKVIKEFEKTMEFVKNASSLKVMPSLGMESPAPALPDSQVISKYVLDSTLGS